tara:strand:+ start:19222 stop:19794 length:573 start_codon:yes stop_codon:yes gene_type:complete
MMFYTGIGSRETPEDTLDIMRRIGFTLAKYGFTLRSGAAGGADEAFEYGCRQAEGKAQLFVPWAGFCSRESTEGIRKLIPTQPRFEEAKHFLLDNNIIPWFNNMKQGAQKLHARNYYQIKGVGDEPMSDFVIAYSELNRNGEPTGGTRTAILLAEQMGVPVFNLATQEGIDRCVPYLEEKLNAQLSKHFT